MLEVVGDRRGGRVLTSSGSNWKACAIVSPSSYIMLRKQEVDQRRQRKDRRSKERKWSGDISGLKTKSGWMCCGYWNGRSKQDLKKQSSFKSQWYIVEALKAKKVKKNGEVGKIFEVKYAR